MKKIILVFFLAVSLNKCFSQKDDTLTYTTSVPFQYPQVKKVTVLPNDTSYIRIIFTQAGLKVKTGNEWITFDSAKKFNKFVCNAKDKIRSKMILLVGSSKIKYELFSPVVQILKNNNLYKFEMITKDLN